MALGGPIGQERCGRDVLTWIPADVRRSRSLRGLGGSVPVVVLCRRRPANAPCLFVAISATRTKVQQLFFYTLQYMKNNSSLHATVVAQYFSNVTRTPTRLRGVHLLPTSSYSSIPARSIAARPIRTIRLTGVLTAGPRPDGFESQSDEGRRERGRNVPTTAGKALIF